MEARRDRRPPFELTDQARAGLVESAKAVLDGNRAGDSTKPSPDLYPHQWMWDSCFIAIGVSNYDPERAQKEIKALLRGQWLNGMVPQIIFNPTAGGYFPGPDVWQSERSPHAPPGVSTSGITQPPVLATAALAAYGRDPDRSRAEAFAREVYPKIKAYHEFLYRERNPDGSGLIVVVHPWESGLDNSPPYLDAGSRVQMTYRPRYTRLDTRHVSAANRPTDKDYDLFVWLLERMREVDYSWETYLRDAPLQVEDVLFNCILANANRDLQSLAEALGIVEEDERGRVSPFLKYGTEQAIQRKLWDEESGLYHSFDRAHGALLTDPTVASLMPLTLRHSGAEPGSEDEVAGRRARLEASFDDTRRFATGGYLCPTTALSSRRFDGENYWLGPVWVNTNWLLSNGASPSLAGRLRSDILELGALSGYREYFNPFTGRGYGTDRFSWSAALTIDILSNP